MSEILIVSTNLLLAHVTFLAVPEEHRPHFVRHIHHHTARLARVITRRPAPYVGGHRRDN
jgi:hypothetical protein